jgi:predicted  nucleic acid-binding Zn-ribbon protein
MSTQTTQTAQEQPLKYADLLARSKEQKDEATRQIQVDEAAQDLESEILRSRKAILSSERRLHDLKGTFPLDIKGINSEKQELGDLKEGLKTLNELKAELF